jgi:hypothetical protein
MRQVLLGVANGCGLYQSRASLEGKSNKKPTVSARNLSVSRVFPVDDSARVESPTVCLDSNVAIAILISFLRDSDHRLRSPSVFKVEGLRPGPFGDTGLGH